MSNALHDYAKLFERYAANNGGTGAILAGEDCLSLANEMRMDADAIDAENAKLRKLVRDALRPKYDHTLRMPPAKWREYDADVLRRACELGIEVDR